MVEERSVDYAVRGQRQRGIRDRKCDIKEGDELIMENDILKKTEKRERTWKDDYKLVEKKVAKKE